MTYLVRGTLVHCPVPPGEAGAELESIDDGVLLVEKGRIARIGPASELLTGELSSLPLLDYRGRLIMPGMVDVHVHYPQTDIIASYGEQLLEWLNRYTFPAEAAFADTAVAAETAEFFLDELLRNGTTSALVLGTVHPGSVDAVFGAAERRGMRLAAGKVLMDRNAPGNLRDSAASAYRDSRELIERWHGRDRLLYAITPRFAPTSSEAQLVAVGRLAREYPDAYLHTHVAENRAEVEWVRELFPGSRSYLDVYDGHGLVRERSVFAHCIHLDDDDRRRMAGQGAVAAFCPTSNLFLGSGLFDYAQARAAGVRVGLATDVGAGTSFSMFRTAAEAYKVSALLGRPLSAATLLYLCTRAGAEALYLDDRIGWFGAGMEADFIVAHPGATAMSRRRDRRSGTIAERLFALFMLGDDRHVEAVFVNGSNRLSTDAGRQAGRSEQRPG